MLKVQIHPATVEGKPLPGSGEIHSGRNASEVIEAMKLQSSFTACLPEREYIDGILGKIMPDEELTELDATEFLTKLAEKGFISFLTDDEPLSVATAEVTPCADKQV